MKTSLACRCALLILVFAALNSANSQQAPPNPPPDDRYKADILVVVAHPDDDSLPAAYLAKEIFDQHKRAAVIFGTRGNSGGNVVGQEQSDSLAAVREIEAHRALATLGVMNIWFLNGPDTPGQDVLRSLETWHHGTALADVVRLVRLTRPEVILTWLPEYVAGENHDDHQAAGVLATEAFDMAANPLVFPEQVTPPRNRNSISNYGEGLHPWQPKKIYYFSDASHFEFLEGKGPQYNTAEISPSKHVSYSQLAFQEWDNYKSQNGMSKEEMQKYVNMPVRFVFGKSLVGGNPTDDIFVGVTSLPIAYRKPHGYEPPPPRQGLSIELGGPWHYYKQFWAAHDLTVVPTLLPQPESALGSDNTVWVPILIHNDTDSDKQVTLRSSLPAGWIQRPNYTAYPVRAHDTYPVSLRVVAPDSQKNTWQNLSWSAESGGQQVGTVSLKVHVNYNGVPQ